MTRYSGNVVPIRSDVYDLHHETSTITTEPSQFRILSEGGWRNYIHTNSVWEDPQSAIYSVKPAFSTLSPVVGASYHSTEAASVSGRGVGLAASVGEMASAWAPGPLQKKVEALEAVALTSVQAIGRLEARVDALISAVAGSISDEGGVDPVSLPVDQATIAQLAGQSLAIAMNRLADDGQTLEPGLREFVRGQLCSPDGQLRAAAARALAFGAPDIAEQSIPGALASEQNRAVAGVMKGALQAIAS